MEFIGNCSRGILEDESVGLTKNFSKGRTQARVCTGFARSRVASSSSRNNTASNSVMGECGSKGNVLKAISDESRNTFLGSWFTVLRQRESTELMAIQSLAVIHVAVSVLRKRGVNQ